MGTINKMGILQRELIRHEIQNWLKARLVVLDLSLDDIAAKMPEAKSWLEDTNQNIESIPMNLLIKLTHLCEIDTRDTIEFIISLQKKILDLQNDDVTD